MKFLLLIIMSISINLSCNNANSSKNSDDKSNTTKKDTAFFFTQKDTTTTASTDEMVAQIRKDYEQINTLKLTPQKFDFKYPEEPDSDGSVTYFVDNDQSILKIVAKQSIPDYEETVEYYYRKNKVYFVFKNANFWAADAKERKYTQRWYVHNDSIIKEMNDNEVMEFKDSTRTTIAYKLLAAYKTKDFVQAISDKQK
jgi:hypothetical protein